jgi:ectoine hydroxylase-related dioxygenase (phytanoyl-CoA dioxygenase family)
MKSMYPELNLDLTFHPVVCGTPRCLTREQIDQYNEQGYLSNLTVLEGGARAAAQEFFQRSRKELIPSGLFQSFHHLIPELYDIVVNPILVDYLQDLLGPSIVCHVSQYICKDPGADIKVVWHQDASFNPTDARCVVVWTAIDDAVIENGCMWFIPGSHRLGALDCLEAGHEVPDAEAYGPKVPIELKAGQAVVFSDLLLHSSPGNRSVHMRRGGLTATYASAELVPTLGRKKWSVLCCGEDPNNHWQVHPRPSAPGALVSR